LELVKLRILRKFKSKRKLPKKPSSNPTSSGRAWEVLREISNNLRLPQLNSKRPRKRMLVTLNLELVLRVKDLNSKRPIMLESWAISQNLEMLKLANSQSISRSSQSKLFLNNKLLNLKRKE
jgi:hypothetical protein